MKGRHQLSIKVDEEHVKGSPFGVAVKLPIVKLGTPILTIDGVKRPWGVAVTKKGEVVVTENHGSCISIFALSVRNSDRLVHLINSLTLFVGFHWTVRETF